MKNTLLFLFLAIVLCGCTTMSSRQPVAEGQCADWRTDDFSWINGVNYIPSYAQNDVEIWRDFDPAVIDRELGYAERIGINCIRVFLQVVVYEDDPELFLERFETFLDIGAQHGITMMPTLFDSCFGAEPSMEAQGWVSNPGFAHVSQAAWPGCERFVEDIVQAHIGDPRIAVWDVMNEPMVAGAHAANDTNKEKIWRFVRHFVQKINTMDPTHATTVGVAGSGNLPNVQDVVRVLSFHSYTGDADKFKKDLQGVQALGATLGKASFISEMGNFDLNQTYPMIIKTCQDVDMGYFFWELMIGESPFPRITGIFYPDGTIRSGEDLAAVSGFFVRPVEGQYLARYNWPLPLFLRRLDEALAYPTWGDNFERRLVILNSSSPAEIIGDAYFKEKHPDLVERLNSPESATDYQLILAYYGAKNEAMDEWRKKVEAVHKLYMAGDKEAAYKQTDALLRDMKGMVEAPK